MPFSNDLLALASCEFSAVAKFFSVNAGMALKRIQECILLSYTQDLLDDNEFCLLYDANYANYPDLITGNIPGLQSMQSLKKSV